MKRPWAKAGHGTITMMIIPQSEALFLSMEIQCGVAAIKIFFNCLPSHFNVNTIAAKNNYLSFVKRNPYSNSFDLAFNGNTAKEIFTPFLTLDGITNAQLLADTLHVPVKNNSFKFFLLIKNAVRTIYSQPVDSLLRIMMHRSDNFYAEQSLLMLCNKKLGTMNDEKIINTLLNSDLKELPQKPQWVDGSGLSRFNLFSPQDFVFYFK